MKKQTLEIIEMHRLTPTRVSEISKITRDKVWYYMKRGRNIPDYEQKIEEAIMDWHKQLMKNRCKIFKNTKYEYLYCESETSTPYAQVKK